jgi:hypothetical protein
MQHRKAIWGLAIAIVALLGVSTSVAVAQSGRNPDGSTASEASGSEAAVRSSCGQVIQSIVVTENAVSTTSSTSFVNVPGAGLTVAVPSGATRCIKVLFTAESACSVTSGGDYCYVRALDNGVEMNPQGASFQAIASEASTARGHAFEWVRRVPAGNHAIVLQRRVAAAATVFTIDDWTFDVQVSA